MGLYGLALVRETKAGAKGYLVLAGQFCWGDSLLNSNEGEHYGFN